MIGNVQGVVGELKHGRWDQRGRPMCGGEIKRMVCSRWIKEGGRCVVAKLKGWCAVGDVWWRSQKSVGSKKEVDVWWRSEKSSQWGE